MGARALVGLSALLLLGACGTTVPLSVQRGLQSQGGALNGTGGGLAVGTPGSQGSGSLVPGTLAGQSGQTGGAGALGAAGVSGASGGATGASAGGGGGAGPATSQAGDGPGVTATQINVADFYEPDAAAEDAALGAGGLNPGNTQAETNAIVAYINSHGGVAGRKLNVIWAQVNATSNQQQGFQAACSTWTTDNKTFVLESGLAILDQCTANAHGIAPSSGDIAQEDTAIDQQFPADVNIDGMTLDRSMRYTIEGLQRQGYFSSGAKVGIATWNESDYQYGITHAALPALAAIGIRNPPVEYVTVAQSYGDLGSSSADVSNAILKFREEGIDHVLLFDGTAGVNSSGTLVLLWMNDANSQAWYPAYGLNSTSGLSTIAPDVPSKELQGSLAIGWNPSLDLASGDFNALPLNADGKLCLQILSAAGQSPSGQNAEAVAFAICDRYFFIKYALDKVSGPINQASAMAVINSIGTSFPVISTFEANFSPSEHDGPYLVRNASFNSGCDCFKYTSNPYNPG